MNTKQARYKTINRIHLLNELLLKQQELLKQGEEIKKIRRGDPK